MLRLLAFFVLSAPSLAFAEIPAAAARRCGVDEAVLAASEAARAENYRASRLMQGA